MPDSLAPYWLVMRGNVEVTTSAAALSTDAFWLEPTPFRHEPQKIRNTSGCELCSLPFWLVVSAPKTGL